MPKPEYALQKACVDYLVRFVPEPPEGPAWTACNPVPSKSKAVAGQSKALGLTKGWPDVSFCWRDGRAFHIEFKADGGRLSPEQRYIHHVLSQLNHNVHIVTHLGEFAEALAHEGVPVKAGVAA